MTDRLNGLFAASPLEQRVDQLTARIAEMEAELFHLRRKATEPRIAAIADQRIAAKVVVFQKAHDDAARELNLLAEKTRGAREAGIEVTREEMNEVLR